MTITYWIIGITVVVSWYSFDKPQILTKLLLNPYAVLRNREYYRFITSGFVHANFSHLLWNMFSFYFFGMVVEYYFEYLFGGMGSLLFIVLYLSAIVISDMPSYFKHKDNFLLVDVFGDEDTESKICDFLEIPRSKARIEHYNKGG